MAVASDAAGTSATESSVRTAEVARTRFGTPTTVALVSSSSITTVEPWDNGAGGTIAAARDSGDDDWGGWKQKFGQKHVAQILK